MIGVDEALAAILARFAALEPEERPLLEALGQVLAGDVRAERDVPPLTNAAMDGYAIRSSDSAQGDPARPSRLVVVEDLPAGRCATRSVEPGTAIRIMTGAPLPAGADTVVPFERTDEANGTRGRGLVEIYAPVEAWQNVRLAGEDMRRGQVVLPAGTELYPPQIGILATNGWARALVHRRPRVAILSTGDELLEPGSDWSPGKIYDANGYTLAAMVLSAGGIPVQLGIAPDNVPQVLETLAKAGQVDLIVTSAGVSAGDYDVVKQALFAAGGVELYQVRMRPGRPLAFGALNGVPLLGLPGNPVASAISFEVFGRPAVARMLGRRAAGRPRVVASFRGDIDNYDRRRSYFRVTLEQAGAMPTARLTGPQGSGILMSLAAADGLMVVSETTARVRDGDEVEVWLLDGAEGFRSQDADVR